MKLQLIILFLLEVCQNIIYLAADCNSLVHQPGEQVKGWVTAFKWCEDL